jgi:hypothetical protein
MPTLRATPFQAEARSSEKHSVACSTCRSHERRKAHRFRLIDRAFAEFAPRNVRPRSLLRWATSSGLRGGLPGNCSSAGYPHVWPKRAGRRPAVLVRSDRTRWSATRLPENYRCGLPAVAEPTLNHFANGRGLADSPTLAIEPVLVCLPWPGVECPSWEAASHVR